MNPTAKEKIKQDLGNYYRSLYGDDSVSSKVRWFVWGFFQPPVTFAKLAVYIIGTTTLTTWVYAWVAPESFSQTSNAVSTTVQKAVTTSLEVLKIRPKLSDDTIADDNSRNRGRSSDDSIDSDEIFDDSSNDNINHDLFDDKWGERNDNNSDDRFDDNSRDDDDDRFDDKGWDRVRIDNSIEVKTSNSWKWSSKDENKIKITPIITLRTGTVNTWYVAPQKDSRDYSDDNDDRDEDKDDDRDEDRNEDRDEDRNEDREDDRGERDDD